MSSEGLSVELPKVPVPILFPGISDHELNQIAADRLPEGLTLRECSRTKFAFDTSVELDGIVSQVFGEEHRCLGKFED